MNTRLPELKLLPLEVYEGVNGNDPIRFYQWPIVGRMYRQRVELCLGECRGGEKILEIGFGSGVTFINLNEKYKEIHGLDMTSKVDLVMAVFDSRKIKTHLRNGSVLKMPYPNSSFDTVLSISILEHLKPNEQQKAFQEILRVLKPGGQVVYGVPVERLLMRLMFRLLGYNIHEHHFSTEKDVANAARSLFRQERLITMKAPFIFCGAVYEVGHFVKI